MCIGSRIVISSDIENEFFFESFSFIYCCVIQIALKSMPAAAQSPDNSFQMSYANTCTMHTYKKQDYFLCFKAKVKVGLYHFVSSKSVASDCR